MTRRNRLLFMIFRIASLFRISQKKMAENYVRNQISDGAFSGCINGQCMGEISNLQYGLCKYGRVGCEIIAVYNALFLLGYHPAVSEIGRQFEACRGQMLFGVWGTNPFSAEMVLEKYGVAVKRFEKIAAISDDLAFSVAENGKRAVLILSFWNRKGNIFKGVHTITVEYENGVYSAYNRYDMVPDVLRYKSLDAVLGDGKLIVGYRILKK